MLYCGIKIAKDNSCIVIIDDDTKLYIKKDIIIENTVENIKYLLKSLQESNITPQELVFAINLDHVECADALKKFIDVFEHSTYELRIVNTAVKGFNDIVVTKSRGANEEATGTAVYLKKFFNEPDHFVGNEYSMNFSITTISNTLWGMLGSFIFLVASIDLLLSRSFFLIPHFLIGLVGTLCALNYIWSYTKWRNKAIYKINKTGLTIFANVNWCNIRKLETPCFIPWQDISAINTRISLINRSDNTSGPNFAEVFTNCGYKYNVKGKELKKHSIRFNELGGNAPAKLRTLILYWNTFKRIKQILQ